MLKMKFISFVSEVSILFGCVYAYDEVTIL